MTDRRFVKPASGIVVLDPARVNAPLPPEGDFVAWDSHWQRRLDQGDVAIATPPKAPRKGDEA